MSESRRSIPSLDGLRAVSIILVVVSHISVLQYIEHSDTFSRAQSIVQTLFLLGHLGVTVFFVISGFLIMTLLLKDERVDLKKFYFRRTLRIFPPYYFYLFVVLVCGLAGYLNLSWFNFAAAATYTRNYFFIDSAPGSWYLAHTWSLAVEEQFYLLLPAVLMLFGRRRGLLAVGAAVLAAPLIRLAYVLNDPAEGVEFGRFETVADSLAVGCLLAGLRGELHATRWYGWLMNSNFALLLPPLAVVITWCGYFPKYFPRPLYAAVAVTVQNLAIAVFLDWAVTNPSGRVGKLLNARPIAYIGVLSYSIYLWQQPFLSSELDLPMWARLGLIAAVSLFSYYAIERPSLRLRQYLERADWKKSAAVAVGARGLD